MMLKTYILESIKLLTIKESHIISDGLDERLIKYLGNQGFSRIEMLENFLNEIEKNYTIFTHVGIEIKNMRGENISFGAKGPKGNIADVSAGVAGKMIKSAILNQCAIHFKDNNDIEYCNNELGGRYLHRGGKTIHMWALKNENKKIGFNTLQSLFEDRLASEEIQTNDDVDKIMEPFRLCIYQVPDLKNAKKGSINPLVGKFFKIFVPLEKGTDKIPGWDEVYEKI